MEKIVTDLKPHGDVTAALLMASYLEHALERLLTVRFITMSKEDHKRLFDASAGGILGSFNAKVRIAYAANFVNEMMKHDLLLINDIRNVFAHSLHIVLFSDTLIIQDCARLRVADTLKHTDRTSYVPRDAYDRFNLSFGLIYLGLRVGSGDVNPRDQSTRIVI